MIIYLIYNRIYYLINYNKCAINYINYSLFKRILIKRVFNR